MIRVLRSLVLALTVVSAGLATKLVPHVMMEEKTLALHVKRHSLSIVLGVSLDVQWVAVLPATPATAITVILSATVALVPLMPTVCLAKE